MGNSMTAIKKTIEGTVDNSTENVYTIYSRGDNSYGTITYLNKNNLNIVRLWVSNFQCFAVDIKGNFMSWGLNDYYQLGNGTNIDYVFAKNEKHSTDSFSILSYEKGVLPNVLNKSVPFPFKGNQVKTISCGDGFSLFLLKNGELFGVGRNDKGQLGMKLSFEKCTLLSGKRCLSSVERVDYFYNNKIHLTDIQTCNDFTIVCDENKNYYSWGNNDHFQLCRETLNLSTPEPEKVEAFSSLGKIKTLKVGWMHGVLVTITNKIFIWGNPYFDYNEHFPDLKKPTEIINSASNTITQIASGFHHVAFIAIEDGDYSLYTFGANDFGQLGYETKEDYIPEPRKVSINDKEEGSVISEVVTGAFHTLCRMTSGNIWGFGQNDNGQVGDYANEYITWPTIYNWKMDNNLRLHKIICANASTVIIKKRGMDIEEDEEDALKVEI